MLSYPIQIRPDDTIKEIAEINRKISKGLESLSSFKDEDIKIGTTPKETVYKEDKLRLHHYIPLVDQPHKTPLLISYALVNRYLIADLQEDRSLIRNLLNQGIDVYLIEWGDPAPQDKYLTLDDYVNGYLNNCVDVIRERHGLDKINLFGICQGGTLATCFSALYPEKVQTLTLTVTPIDFHAGRNEQNPELGLLFNWGQAADVDLLVEAYGNVPSEVLNFSFLMAKPFALNFGKYADMIEMLDDETALMNFLRMEKWLFDGPDCAGEAYREFINNFVKDNKLVKNQAEIGGKKINLGKVTMPVYNVYAAYDHLVPPACTVALGKHVGSDDYTELKIPAGHIGIYVGSKAQKMLAPSVAEWLKERS
ncbi:MAG: class III poly(R)-hydroxyalkanoic acid synthase subunit PhaC [Gammaproteobacteria bacterium]|nr:class III poly(R)-hydroxyalkanoic acid synthase subunit PhaC [Gammaproteobacteria bacterium]